MNSEQPEALYLEDIFRILLEKALEAKASKDAAKNMDGYDFELGRLMAYHEVISLLQAEATVFSISQGALAGLNPEVDLL